MNAGIFGLVFSRRLGCLVVTGETTRRHGKGSARGEAAVSAGGGCVCVFRAVALAAALASSPFAALTQNLPDGGAIVRGSGTISQSGTTMTVQQNTDRMAANWGSFNIGAGHTVIFNQPSASAVALNRVLGGSRSEIYGNLQANGQIFLINPNGVLFGRTAEVNVGGLFATTKGITDDAFMAGDYRFSGADAGEVVNQGRLRAANGGYIVLAGQRVTNDGTVSAPGGTAALAAGEKITLKLDGPGNAGVMVDGAVVNALVANGGLIEADGGQVLLTARGRDMLQANVMNLSGVVRARSSTVRNGVIVIDGGVATAAHTANTDTGNVVLDGAKLDVSGLNTGEKGGRIEVTGKNIGLFGDTTLDARGDAGGGTVLVGGDWKGGGTMAHAEVVAMQATARIDASATGNGDGGQVVLWSDEYTGFHGGITARGGASGGNGGRVETSSKTNLQAMGSVDAGAADGTNGAAGQWLLDPLNVNITTVTANTSQAGGNFTPTASPATIDVATINAALNAGTAVTVDTGAVGAEAGNITVSSAIAKTAGADTSLTLNAAGAIAVNAGISSTSNQLAATLNANGGAVSGTGAINTNGGLLTVNAASGTGTLSGVISGAGGLTKAGAGTTILTASNTYTGATTVNAGTLQIGVGTTTGAIAGASAASVAAGATLAWNTNTFVGSRTITNNISGAGTLLLQGQNATTALQVSDYRLTGNNTGLTGTLRLDRAILYNTTLQSQVGSATIEVGDRATIGFNGSTFTNNLIIQNGAGWHHNVSGSDVVLGAIRLEGNNTLSGNIQLNNTTSVVLGDGTGANSTISSYSGGTNTLSGVISGAGDFAMSRFTGWNGGSGAPVNIILSGAQSNTYTGKTVVDGQGGHPTLTLAKTGGAVAIAAGTTVQMGSNTGGQANLRMGADNQFGAGVAMNFVNASGQWMRFDLMGTQQTLAGITAGTASTQAGAVIQDAGLNASTAVNGTLTLNGTGTYVFNGVMRNTDTGGGTGLLNLVKSGTGSQMLVGAATQTGTTTVNGGTLSLYNSAYNSATTVNAGTTLELAGNTFIAHNFAINLNNGSTLSKTNTGYDTFNTSDVTVNGTVAINVTNNGVDNQLFIGGAATGLQGTGTINLTNTGGTTTGLMLRSGTGNFSGTMNVNGGQLSVNNGGALALQNTDVNLTGSARLNLATAFGSTASNASVKTLAGASTETVTLGAQILTIGTNNGTGADFAGVISGTGAVTKTGTGTQTLSGSNTYSGTTAVNAGTLVITNNAGLGGTLGGTTVATGATLDLRNVAVGAEAVTLSGGTLATSTGTSSLAGNVALGVGGGIVDVTGTQLSLSGVVSGSNALTKTGAGTAILSGTNTYSGATGVNAGTLAITNNAGLGSTVGSTTVAAGATLDLRNVTVGAEAVTLNGATLATSTGASSLAGGITLGAGGGTVDVTGTQLTLSGVISGATGVTKTGAGTAIVTGNSTYTGTTTVSAGTLQVGNNGTTGRLGTGAVTTNANLVFNRSDTVALSALASNAAGITGTGNVSALIGGGFTVDRDITLTGAGSTILLEAGKGIAASTATGGDVTLTNNISTSATGTVTIFSGNANTAALEAKVSGATGATRYKTYNTAVGSMGGAVAGTRNYYYRQAPAALTVTGLTATKTYDGLTDATAVLNGGAAVVNGMIDGDTLTYGALTGASATFNNAHAGARTVSASFTGATPVYAGGGATWSVAGYTAGATGSTAGTITPKQLTTAINAVGKAYDGTTTTTSTLAAPTGFVGNDSATGVGGLTLAFDNPNAGARNVVATGTGSLTGFTPAASGNGSGVGAGNQVAGLASDYTVATPPSAAATITGKTLTVTANDDAKLVTQTDAAGYNGVSYSGFVNGETAASLGGALAISRTNGGTQGAGTYAGVLAPTGYTSGNYSITYVNGNYKILPAQQLLVKIQNVNNIYGTNPGYAITSVQYVDINGVTIHTLGQTAQNGNTYTYSDGVGGSTTFTVAAQGATVSTGSHLNVGNYTLSGTNASIVGNNFLGANYTGNQGVTQAPLTASGNTISKVYDGNANITGASFNLATVQAGDVVSVSGGGTYNARNAGTGLGYTIGTLALGGADAGNYYLTNGSGFTGTNGVITPRPITATGITALNKPYDGTVTAQLNTGGVGFNNFIAGDALLLASATGAFADPFVATGKPVTVNMTLGGADAGNYALAPTLTTFADITAVPAVAPAPAPIVPLPSDTYQASLLTAQRTGENVDGQRVDVTQSEESSQLSDAARGEPPSSVRCVSGGIRLPPGVAPPGAAGGACKESRL